MIRITEPSISSFGCVEDVKIPAFVSFRTSNTSPTVNESENRKKEVKTGLFLVVWPYDFKLLFDASWQSSIPVGLVM